MKVMLVEPAFSHMHGYEVIFPHGYASMGAELAGAQWNEGDVFCSVVRRVALPDAFFAIGHEGQTLTVIPSRRLVVVRMGASIHVDAWNQAAFVAALQHAV